MGRLLALILGGLALALYLPPFFFKEPVPVEAAPGATTAPPVERSDYDKIFVDTIGAPLTDKLRNHGAGVFAGLALILLSIRGSDARE
jgi:hypothetical protein